jgi:hypothetical protein
MNRPTFIGPTFIEGVWVAIMASIAGAAVFTVLASFFSGGAVLRWVITGAALCYVLYLLSRSSERSGRVAVLTLWLIAVAAAWFISPPLPLYVAFHAGMIWIIRSLYFHSSAVGSLADLGISGVSMAAGLWAGLQTHSVFLSIWCFFLTQALFVAVPTGINALRARTREQEIGEDRFENAHRAAEAALRKFSSIHSNS